MRGRLNSFALWALLVLPLTMSPILGLLTPYVTLAFTIPVFLWTSANRRFGEAYRPYAARALLAVFLVFVVQSAVAADSFSDALRAFNFTYFFTFGAVTLMLHQKAGEDAAQRIATLATVGVVGGFVAVLLSAAMGHSARPTAMNIGPIVLSNALLALGFLGMGGALVRRDAAGFGYLIGPPLAIGATLITGSRGPLISVPFALAAAGFFFWRLRFASSRRAAVVVVVALFAIAVSATVAWHGRAGTLLDIAHSLADGEAVGDESTRQRIVLYSAGLQSFLQSPWIGHGWANIMGSVLPFLPAADGGLVKLPQLHNDLLNFAVAGGALGIICYFIVLTAPLIGAILTGSDALRPFRIYATTMVLIVYAGGGLTDLMFGFEFHTFMFAMLNAIILGQSRASGTGLI